MAEQDNQPNLSVIANDIGYIKDDVKEIKSSLATKYVSQDQFAPIQKIVYGLVGLILVAVVGALLGLVVTKT